MKKPTLCVIFGGKSSEYEVSLRSAYGVLSHLDTNKYEVARVGIAKTGEWYLFEGDNEEILKDKWQSGKTVMIALDLTCGHIVAKGKEFYAIKVDLFLPILHGEYGEDGRIQGLLDTIGGKYVGCDAFSSHICMDKSLAKEIANSVGVCVAKGMVVNAECKIENAECSINGKFGYPVFVKPTMCGSSVGVSRGSDEKELNEGIRLALKYGECALIEEYIDGDEVEIGVLETKNGLVLSDIGTVKHKGVFYDYDTKYKSQENEYIIPAPTSKKSEETIRNWAKKLFLTFGCKGLARFDFFVKKDGGVVFNEVNTMPGFTESSMFPLLFKGVGLDYYGVIETMIENGIC